MATSRLPEDVKIILTDHIDSVGQLQVLLVFFNKPNMLWTAQSLSQELRGHETIINHQLHSLEASGYIEQLRPGEFAFTKKAEMLAKASLLHDAYRDMSVAVIAHIYDKPNEKLQGFADAFKLKKD